MLPENIRSNAILHWSQTIDDIDTKIASYEKLWDDMQELRKKSYVETMVPINKVAFFKGKLKHQNELMVFLGGDYFVERTVDECKPIIDRRIKSLTNDRKEFEQSMNEESIKSELTKHITDSEIKSKTNPLQNPNPENEKEWRWNDDGTFEIREELDEEDEKSNSKETNDLDTVDISEEETERLKELHYQETVQKHPDFIARKKGMIFFIGFSQNT